MDHTELQWISRNDDLKTWTEFLGASTLQFERILGFEDSFEEIITSYQILQQECNLITNKIKERKAIADAKVFFVCNFVTSTEMIGDSDIHALLKASTEEYLGFYDMNQVDLLEKPIQYIMEKCREEFPHFLNDCIPALAGSVGSLIEFTKFWNYYQNYAGLEHLLKLMESMLSNGIEIKKNLEATVESNHKTLAALLSEADTKKITDIIEFSFSIHYPTFKQSVIKCVLSPNFQKCYRTMPRDFQWKEIYTRLDSHLSKYIKEMPFTAKKLFEILRNFKENHRKYHSILKHFVKRNETKTMRFYKRFTKVFQVDCQPHNQTMEKMISLLDENVDFDDLTAIQFVHLFQTLPFVNMTSKNWRKHKLFISDPMESRNMVLITSLLKHTRNQSHKKAFFLKELCHMFPIKHRDPIELTAQRLLTLVQIFTRNAGHEYLENYDKFIKDSEELSKMKFAVHVWNSLDLVNFFAFRQIIIRVIDCLDFDSSLTAHQFFNLTLHVRNQSLTKSETFRKVRLFVKSETERRSASSLLFYVNELKMRDKWDKHAQDECGELPDVAACIQKTISQKTKQIISRILSVFDENDRFDLPMSAHNYLGIIDGPFNERQPPLDINYKYFVKPEQVQFVTLVSLFLEEFPARLFRKDASHLRDYRMSDLFRRIDRGHNDGFSASLFLDLFYQMKDEDNISLTNLSKYEKWITNPKDKRFMKLFCEKFAKIPKNPGASYYFIWNSMAIAEYLKKSDGEYFTESLFAGNINCDNISLMTVVFDENKDNDRRIHIINESEKICSRINARGKNDFIKIVKDFLAMDEWSLPNVIATIENFDIDNLSEQFMSALIPSEYEKEGRFLKMLQAYFEKVNAFEKRDLLKVFKYASAFIDELFLECKELDDHLECEPENLAQVFECNQGMIWEAVTKLGRPCHDIDSISECVKMFRSM